jgi:prepilin-type N-terminal cleavage/methylation domain-containing protein
MRKKGFTLVELLVVIAIIAMLLAILMPALAKVKTLAYQMLCGTNLKGISSAILVYGQDNNEKYPVAGKSGGLWNMNADGVNPAGNTGWNWDAPDKSAAANGKGSVSACLYLLVKYADVSPGSFVCKAGKQKKLNILASQTDTSLTAERSAISTDAAVRAKDATECWDFSQMPSRYCSYAYAYPWDPSKLPSTATKMGVAVAGDLNPWIQPNAPDTTSPKVKFATAATPANNLATNPGYDSPQLIVANTAFANYKLTWVSGNSLTHDTVGQNILFNDMHVEFSKQPNPDSAVQNDNIYTPWENSTGPGNRPRGIQPTNTGETLTTMRPQHKDDSYLVQW